MDKNGARGRAEKIVSGLLEGCLQSGMVGGILSNRYGDDKDAVTAITKEIQAIANEHARLSLLHKAIEQGTADRRLIAHNYMNDPLTFSIEKDEEESATASVMWGGLLGYSMVKLYCTTPVEADRLFEALQKVCGVEED